MSELSQDTLEQVRESIRKPLLWASRDGYRNLGALKGMERLVSGLVLKVEASQAVSEGEKQMFRRLGSLFEAFDGLDLQLKKERVFRALGMLKEGGDRAAFGPDKQGDWAEREREFSKSIQFAKGVGSRLAEVLGKKGIRTIEDALYFFPRSYEDRRAITNLGACRSGQKVCCMVAVDRADIVYYHRSRKRIFEMRVYDKTGSAKLKWFHFYEGYVKARFKKHQVLLIWGEGKFYAGGLEFVHPEVEVLGSLEKKGSRTDHRFLDIEAFKANLEEGIHYGRVVPIYSETEGLYQRTLRRILYYLTLQAADLEVSALPEEIRERQNLCPIQQALRSIHFPPPEATLEEMRDRSNPYIRRLVFEELFLISLGLAQRRARVSRAPGIRFERRISLMNRCVASLPFRLTGAQERVVAEILEDMSRPAPMNRLIQGDVGSGKTLVAVLAALVAVENGYQAAIMAPTEILAAQHYDRIRNLCDPLGVTCVLLTGSQNVSERRKLCEGIESGKVSLVIGTHALIQETVAYWRLGLCIVDEQHRFGVEQRARLVRKGMNPDMLVMTATPIPRTLAMTLYGDLDISILDEMPKGRKAILTKVYTQNNTKGMLDIIRRELQKGGQVYFVYPLVEESEESDLKDATRQAEALRRDYFPGERVLLLHGRMSQEEKDAVMGAFQRGEAKILVSTTVIEVGVDVPAATVMVVENAERFGLSQLHQLRGRVGRGDRQGYCFLVASHLGSADIMKRLRIMEETTDGFKIAEVDLEIRGPGELLGTRQSGIPEFRAARLPVDLPVLEAARREAFDLINRDPDLEGYPELKAVLEKYWRTKLELARIG